MTELVFDEFGPRSKPTILLLHGGGGGRWMWRSQVERLSADYHLIVPDLPGHGDSASIRLVSIQDAASRIADLVRERAHGKKAHAVGLSLGAQVVVYLLAQAPERVDRAIVSSALLTPLKNNWMYSPGLLRFLFKTSVEPFRNSRWWARVNMKYSGGIPDEYFPEFFQDFQRMGAEQFVDTLRVGLHNHIPDGLYKVKSPTLVLCGQKEYKEMKASTRALAAALPEGTAYEVTYPANVPMREQHNWSMTFPERFTDTVRAWIEGKPLPEGLKKL